jgi:hypothetical protein
MCLIHEHLFQFLLDESEGQTMMMLEAVQNEGKVCMTHFFQRLDAYDLQKLLGLY